ncbi:hypothetical protein FPZ12_027390 [Amycolatopsis acidicola]|uniref:Uncharacterized protein n=1 Tax=Amycolatopsis acidicola TaxID=2596893 RepID=A0A5N0UVN6_9PSEU|nr:hypothetical protein [Amycolatopsis acidicola]KAA9156572.1 hypothetical protein FPZ12_027390 [Amycolatopsis acidicola]
MTHAAPNPGGFDPFFRQRKEEQLVESRRGAGEPNPGGHEEPAGVEEGDELVPPEGPFSLDRLRAHEEARAAARRAGNTGVAGEALQQVAADLVQLLDLARDQIKETGKGASRQRVRATFPKVKTGLEPAFTETAEFLGLAPERVADVQRTLARDGGVAPADRHQALKDVDALRAQVREATTGLDHEEADRLLSSVARLAVLEIAGGPPVKDSVQAGFAALATFALRDPATSAGEPGVWHERLNEQAKQTSYGEKVLVGVRCCAARVVTLSLDWEEKEQYWQLLGEIETARSPRPDLDGLVPRW